MKVALVHDWLNNKFGGGENMLMELANLYPDAPIFTLLHNPEVTRGLIAGDRVHPSNLQRLPRFIRERSRYLLPFAPTAIEQFDLSGYDVVISTSSAFAKGVITKPETLHICYCFSPMRFAWDYWPRYIDEQAVGPVRRALVHRLVSKVRIWDYYSSFRVDRWTAISQTTAHRIEKYYRQEVEAVIYPGAEIGNYAPSNAKSDFFVTLSSLTPYKKIDLAIAACNQLGRKLIVIGDGSDRARLEQLAGPTIEFAGRVSDQQKAKLLAEAEALIFPNEEDFGIAPIEAMASGTPVIAYNRGGLTETVKAGVTGEFFDQPTVEALGAVLKNFQGEKYATADLTKQAEAFSLERFRIEMPRYVEKADHEHQKNLH